MKLWNESRAAAAMLAVAGFILMGMGGFFAILRPALLPEDLRYIAADPMALLVAAPGILGWLRHVFTVLGGYIFATGLLTLHVAVAALRTRRSFPIALMALAGLTSLGTMAAVNFAIQSDFKWLLASFAALWAAAMLLALFDTRSRPAAK